MPPRLPHRLPLTSTMPSFWMVISSLFFFLLLLFFFFLMTYQPGRELKLRFVTSANTSAPGLLPIPKEFLGGHQQQQQSWGRRDSFGSSGGHSGHSDRNGGHQGRSGSRGGRGGNFADRPQRGRGGRQEQKVLIFSFPFLFFSFFPAC